MTATDTRELYRVRAHHGVAAAQAFAATHGYAVRWDREGNLYIRDLLA